MSQNDSEKQQKPLPADVKSARERWETLKPKEFFFVPSLDPDRDKKILLAMGYVPGKYPPEVAVGMYKGMLGVLCRRRGTFRERR